MADDKARGKGMCPNCYKSRGGPWDPCPGEACAPKHYHHIPAAYYGILEKHPKKRDLMLGQVLDKRYLLVQKIGAGGMGSVFLGLQRPFDRKVAVKIISGVDVTRQLRARFEREARALSMLDHPNIVKLADYGIQHVPIFETELPFMVLEYVEGGVELGKFFKQMQKSGKNVSRKTLFHIFSQVLDALATAHSQGLIHRDIKPGNIMLKKVQGNPFFVKVLDFGLAKAITGVEESGDTSLTRGMIIGTPQYMAPEQGKMGAMIDHRADLYAVGAILFETLCGVRPYEGENAMDILLKKNDPGNDPFQLPQAQALPDATRVFLKKAIALAPDNRFSDALGFKAALQTALFRSQIQVMGPVHTDRPPTSDSGRSIYDSDTLAMAGDSDATLAMASSELDPLYPKKPWMKPIFGLATAAVLVVAGYFVLTSFQKHPYASGSRAEIIKTSTLSPRDYAKTAQVMHRRLVPAAVPSPPEKQRKKSIAKRTKIKKVKKIQNTRHETRKKKVKKHGWTF